MRAYILLLFAILAACAHTEGSELAAAVDVSIEEQGDIFDSASLIRRGEVYFEKQDYPEAAAEFSRFLELHKTHRMAPFAAYRLGYAYYRQHDTIDRDLELIEKSLEAFQRIVRDHPASIHAEDSRRKIAELSDLIAKRELYIGWFYFRRGAYRAAVGRLFPVARQESSGSEEALYYLALSYLKLNDRERAEQAAHELESRYPAGKFRRLLTPRL